MIEAERGRDCQDFAREHAAGDDQNLFGIGAFTVCHDPSLCRRGSGAPGEVTMFNSLTRIVAIVAVVGFVAGCANTIRGVGQDTAQTVDATQQAGRNVARSAD